MCVLALCVLPSLLASLSFSFSQCYTLGPNGKSTSHLAFTSTFLFLPFASLSTSEAGGGAKVCHIESDISARLFFSVVQCSHDVCVCVSARWCSSATIANACHFLIYFSFSSFFSSVPNRYIHSLVGRRRKWWCSWWWWWASFSSPFPLFSVPSVDCVSVSFYSDRQDAEAVTYFVQFDIGHTFAITLTFTDWHELASSVAPFS